MIGKKINELATELDPISSDLTIIGDPSTGVSKKVTLAQIASLFSGAIVFVNNYASLPVTGTIDIIYCLRDSYKIYIWNGGSYVETLQILSQKGAVNGYASLDSLGKVPISQLPSSIMEYKGMWSAATNTPTLANGTGDTGDVYICNVAGSVNFGAGVISFAVGDYVIYSGSIWQRSSGATGTVTSVALSVPSGLSVSGSPITTSGTLALSFTSGYSIPTTASQTTWDTAYSNRITSLTTTGTSGAATLIANVLNIPQYQAAGTYVTSVTGTSPIVSSGGTTPAISIPMATTSVNGYLSSTDWTTFNNKQSALTNPVTGSGTTNYLPKFTGASTIGNSLVYDNGTNVGIGTTSPAARLVASNNGGTGYEIDPASASGTVVSLSAYDRSAAAWRTTRYSGLDHRFETNGTTEAMRITSGGNVGIGTTSPGAPLSFADSNALKIQLNGGTGNYYGIEKQAAVSSGDGLFKFESGKTSAGEFAFSSGGTQRLLIASTGAATFSSNISAINGYMFANGEGNGFMLDSATAVTARTGFMKYGGYEGMIISGNTTKIRLAHRTDSDYVYGGTPTIREDLTITSGGNVLIGTSSDAGYKLDVNGTGRFSGTLRVETASSPGINIVKDATADNRYIRFTNSQASSKNWDIINQTNASNNELWFYESTTQVAALKLAASTGAATFSSSVTGKGYINNYLDQGAFRLFNGSNTFIGGIGIGAWVDGTSTTDIGIYSINTLRFYSGNGTNERMRITNGGNVLIGTIDAGYKLDVNGTGRFSGALTGTSATFSSSGLFNGELSVGGSISSDRMFQVTGTAFTSGTSQFAAVINPTMTGPITDLYGLYLNLNSNSSTVTNAYSLYINGQGGSSSFTNQWAIYQVGSNKNYFGGNVGIGTTSPSHLLTLNNVSSGGTYLDLFQTYVDGNDWRNWTIGTNNQAFGDFNIIQSNATGGNPTSAGTSRLYISKSGNVGIGTTSPSYLLDVNGTGRFSGNLYTQYISVGNDIEMFGGHNLYLYNSTNTSYWWQRNNANAYELHYNAIMPLTIASTGAATFSSTLGINGVADNIKSGTYTPTLAGVYNVTSTAAFPSQYMRVGNVVTVSGVVSAKATAANTWTRVSISLPINSNFDWSYRAGGGGGAGSTGNVCSIQAGASTSLVYLDVYPPSTTLTYDYHYSFTYTIM
ncbi:MAG: hypothetical protein D4R41_01850 [Sediminibacterium sp.]|nr:MAG: hypothetical protein D4R41_01850 [Sediminibacterium sp.]